MTDTNKSTDTNNEWKERDIGALWKREGKNQRYLSGKLTIDGKVTNVVVFVNKFKEKENQPDFRIYEDRPREEVTKTDSTEQPQAADMDSDLPAVLQ